MILKYEWKLKLNEITSPTADTTEHSSSIFAEPSPLYENNHYHEECLRCNSCGLNLTGPNQKRARRFKVGYWSSWFLASLKLHHNCLFLLTDLPSFCVFVCVLQNQILCDLHFADVALMECSDFMQQLRSFKPQSLGCAVARRKSSTTLIFPLPPQACSGKMELCFAFFLRSCCLVPAWPR